MPTLDIVIVNWNSGPHLRECLESIARADTSGLELQEVTVVDNGSTDDSAHRLEFDLPLNVTRNPNNAGFARACNQGAAAGKADHILFLNPDTRLFVDSLVTPVTFMESAAAADVAICGARLIGEGDRLQPSCARHPSVRIWFGGMTRLSKVLPGMFPKMFLDEEECRVSRRVDQVSGAFLLIRRSIFEQLGGFDERYFLYYEEVDLCLRVRQLGLATYYLADAAVYHEGEVSSRNVPSARLTYSLFSRLLYCFKNLGRKAGWELLALTFVVEFPLRLASGIAIRGMLSARELISAYWHLIKSLIRSRSLLTTPEPSALVGSDGSRRPPPLD